MRRSNSQPIVTAGKALTPRQSRRWAQDEDLSSSRRSNADSASRSQSPGTSCRLDLAKRKMEEKFQRHEKEYLRLLNVKQAEVTLQQQRTERLQRSIQKEQEAAERAEAARREKISQQRLKNQRLVEHHRRNEELTRQRAKELVEDESTQRARETLASKRKEESVMRIRSSSHNKTAHRAEVYVKNIRMQESRKDELSALMLQNDHSAIKEAMLAERRKSLAEKNLAKHKKFLETRNHQLEEQERLRQMFEEKERAYSETNNELQWINQQVIRDRKELDSAIQRLRSQAVVIQENTTQLTVPSV